MSDRAYRVVIADDVAQLRMVLRYLLERSGRFEIVAEAANGREAITAAAQHEPDLTLLDLSMPVMDGLEALPEIRRAVPSCTVVVLSGFDADRMASRALSAGAAAYLVKGISPDDLIAQLLELLERETAPAAVPSAEPEHVAIELPGELISASRARTFVRQTLAEWSRDDAIDGAMLLTTELVTNAIVHAQSSVRVRVSGLDDRVRVEVADRGRGALTLKAPDIDDTNGRGLLLVEAMSLSWGTSADDREKVVWFEM